MKLRPVKRHILRVAPPPMRLLMGGSPCTHWSIAQSKNRETEPEGIGWELFKNYLIALDKFNPDYFLYENNKSMANPIREQITRELGVEPVLINSALVSAQNRQRLYWTNIPGVIQPEDKGILLCDILESGVKSTCLNTTLSGKAQCLRATCYKDGIRNMVGNTVDRRTCVANKIDLLGNLYGQCTRWGIFSPYGKAPCLTASAGMGGGHIPLYPEKTAEEGRCQKNPTTEKQIYEVRDGFIFIQGDKYPIKLEDGYYIIRKLTVRECMRLQTVPEWYVFPVSSTQAYKMLGNGWTVDVISHILSFCPGITKRTLTALSMYDGMSCGHLALDNLNAHIRTYYATEIDKFAIQTTMRNYPDTIQLGDAFQVRDSGWHL